MGIILWIVFGALVGWVASMVMKTNDGVIMDIMNLSPVALHLLLINQRKLIIE